MQMGLYKLDQDTKKLTQTKLVKVSCIPGHSKLSISDGVPTTIDNEEGPTSPTRFNSRSKVQALAHIVEESLKQATGIKDQFLPGFVHLIT